jgi:DNA-binding beta-propeller fold protein YncE
MKKLSLCGLLVLHGATLTACGGAPPATATGPASEPASKKTAAASSCERRHPGAGAARGSAESARQGSTVALAELKNEALAYIADEDSASLHTIDVERRVELATTKLSGSPAQVLVLADGRVAVTLRDANRVEILEPAASAGAPLEKLCEIPVPSEPVGIAASPDDKKLVVTSAWDKRVTVLDAASGKIMGGADVSREPRAVVVDDDGQRAFVSHVVGGVMSVVDLSGENTNTKAREIDLRVKKLVGSGVRALDEDKLRGGCQGFALAKSIDAGDVRQRKPDAAEAPASGERPLITGTVKAPTPPPSPKPKGRVFAPMVTVDPGDPNVRSFAYYGHVADGVPKEAPLVSVVDAEAERPMTRAVMSLGSRLRKECLLPRAAAVRASTGTLFVTCLGIDTVVELDTRGLDPARLERRRFSVPAGPTGIAIDDKAGRAVVWSQFDAKVSVIDLDEANAKAGEAPVKLASVTYAPPPSVAAAAFGRRLFHATDDARISNDGTACASCHPDGREDALTWSTPEGPRQTIMLAGRAATSAPYGWVGKHGNLKDYITNTFSRLGGTGVRDEQLDALVTYVETMPGPLVERRQASGPEEAALIARGKDIFFSADQGCAGCHAGGAGTDKSIHDVSSKALADIEGGFDTPTLHFLRGTAPYFHDGRYRSLDDLLAATDTKMGHTLALPRRDVTALKAYLETL